MKYSDILPIGPDAFAYTFRYHIAATIPTGAGDDRNNRHVYVINSTHICMICPRPHHAPPSEDECFPPFPIVWKGLSTIRPIRSHEIPGHNGPASETFCD